MRTNNFHDSATIFSSEAKVIELQEDCDGLLSKFWIPLCDIRLQNIPSSALITNISSEPGSSSSQPRVRSGDTSIPTLQVVEHDDLARTRLNVHILSFLRLRNFTTSAEIFGNESRAIKESAPGTKNLLDILWAGFSDIYLLIPDNISRHQEENLLQDDGMLPPMRAAGLNKYIFKYMGANSFHDSAAVFLSEAKVTNENLEDCYGLFDDFWTPLYSISPQINITSEPIISSDTNVRDPPESSSSQPHVRLGGTNLICSTSQPESSTSQSRLSSGIPTLQVADESALSLLDNAGFPFKPLMTVHKENDRDLSRFLACDFSSDGKFLAYGGTKRVVLLWDIDNEECCPNTLELPGTINDIRFQFGTSKCAIASCDDTIRIWDGEGKTTVDFLGRSGFITTVDFSPNDPNMLCTGDSNGDVCFWDAERSLLIHHTKVAEVRIKQVRFQPNNNSNLLAVAFGKCAMVMLVQRKGNGIEANHVSTLEGHNLDVKSVCWDPTGAPFASVSRDCARVWDLAPNKKTTYYELLSGEMPTGGRPFEACIFHPKHPEILIIGSVIVIHFWDFARRTASKEFFPQTPSLVNSFACSSRSIASTSSEVTLWSLELVDSDSDSD